jgi:hypothetical protein
MKYVTYDLAQARQLIQRGAKLDTIHLQLLPEGRTMVILEITPRLFLWLQRR